MPVGEQGVPPTASFPMGAGSKLELRLSKRRWLPQVASWTGVSVGLLMSYHTLRLTCMDCLLPCTPVYADTASDEGIPVTGSSCKKPGPIPKNALDTE